MPLERRELLALGVVGLAAAGAGAIVGPLVFQWQTGASELLAATFLDEKGGPRRLLEWRGRALFCNFWGTWCTPCVEEMPLLDSYLEKIRAKGAELVGIAIDNAANVRQFTAKYRIRYPIFVAGPHIFPLVRRLGNSAEALPFTVVLGAAGAVTYRKLGALKPPELEAVLAGSLD
jgi:thiol-disulfide isomerase/thioredoxin